MVLDELVQALLIEAAHVGHIDQPMTFEVAGLVAALLHHVVLARHRLKVDHGDIAAALEVALLVEHVGDAARHAGRKIAPGLADHHHDAAGHVFAAMVAGALDHGDGAGIAHGEALAGNAAEIAFAGDGAIQHRVADDDRLLRHDARLLHRTHDEAAAGKTFANIIVGFADEIEGDAMGEPGAEALAGRTAQAHPDGVLRQAGMGVTLGDLAR